MSTPRSSVEQPRPPIPSAADPRRRLQEGVALHERLRVRADLAQTFETRPRQGDQAVAAICAALESHRGRDHSQLAS